MAEYLLVITEDGYGRRVPIEEFKKRHRGSKGVSAIKEKDKEVGGAVVVGDSGEVLVISEKGMVLRVDVSEISVMHRTSRGGKLIDLEEGDSVETVLRL